MVGFTQSIYSIDPSHLGAWKSLIIKYYGEEMWKNIVYKPSDNEYILDTDIIWQGYLISKVLPSVSTYPLPKKFGEVINSSIISKTDSIIKSRSSHKGQEVYIQSKEFESKVNTFELLSQLNETENITHWSYSPIKNEVIILLYGRYPLRITSLKCSDTKLSTFDFDDGFVDDIEPFPEWEEDFNIWKKNFDLCPEAHWDDIIIGMRSPVGFVIKKEEVPLKKIKIESIPQRTFIFDKEIKIEQGEYSEEQLMNMFKKYEIIKKN